MAGIEDSVHSVSSAENSVIISDSLTTMEEFSGFDASDPDSEITDPFQGIFYHMMPLQDSTNILFYNKSLFNNILSVLSKQFQFPPAETKKFSLITHVDKKKCTLTIDRDIMSIYASGPGQISWKEKAFKKLAENMFKTYVNQTNTLLNTASLDSQSMSASQMYTHGNEFGNQSLITNTAQEPEAEPPTEQVTQQPEQLEFARLKDSPVVRQISTLMDMISTLQGQITTLTKQVNHLVQLATSESLYRTVDQTSINSTTINQSATDERSRENKTTLNTPTTHVHSPATEIPDLQTRQYSEVVRTSTPRNPSHNTPQRPRPAPRRTQQRNISRPSPTPMLGNSLQDVCQSSQILMIGDSIISSVNQKGLKQTVFKSGIPGAKVDHILNQVKIFDMKKFSHVIVYVGGNDASSGTDIEYFEEVYEQLVQHIHQINSSCQIILCHVCPRGDTSTTEVNEVIQRLSEQHHANLVDLDQAFHDRHGDIIKRYYAADSIHLSSSGIKRLLGTINKEVTLVEDFQKCVFIKQHQSRRRHSKSNYISGNIRDRQRSVKEQSRDVDNFCYKCGENNHTTSRCRHKQQLRCYECGLLGHKSGRCLGK